MCNGSGSVRSTARSESARSRITVGRGKVAIWLAVRVRLRDQAVPARKDVWNMERVVAGIRLGVECVPPDGRRVEGELDRDGFDAFGVQDSAGDYGGIGGTEDDVDIELLSGVQFQERFGAFGIAGFGEYGVRFIAEASEADGQN